MSKQPRMDFAYPATPAQRRDRAGDSERWAKDRSSSLELLRRDLIRHLGDDDALAACLRAVPPEQRPAARNLLHHLRIDRGWERAAAVWAMAFPGGPSFMEQPALPGSQPWRDSPSSGAETVPAETMPGGGLAAAQASASRSAGERLEPALKTQAEASLGLNLDRVRIHRDAAARTAAAALGARAFAVEGDVFLGEGERGAMGAVVAHELAHAAQQRQSMGAKDNAPWKRGARGDGVEREAGKAARAIVRGAKARVTPAEAAQVQCFEGGEHQEIVDEAFDEAAFGREANVKKPMMITVGKVSATPGVFTALQGDFYGDDWGLLEADCNQNAPAVRKLMGRLKAEQDERTAHRQKGDPEPESDGPNTVAAIGSRAKYVTEASRNYAHFSEKNAQSGQLFRSMAQRYPSYAGDLRLFAAYFGANVAQYLSQHFQALERATLAAQIKDPTAAKAAYEVAIAIDAGGCHYLTDAFSSGHMRTPRREIKQVYLADAAVKAAQQAAVVSQSVIAAQFVGAPPELRRGAAAMSLTQSVLGEAMRQHAEKRADFIAKILHDEDNKKGLNVTNLRGDRWRSFGDHHLEDDGAGKAQAHQNHLLVVAAARESAKHLANVHDMAAASAHGSPGDKGATPHPAVSEVTIPYSSLQAILQLIPIPDSDNAPQQEWRPGRCNADIARRADEEFLRSTTESIGPGAAEAAKEGREGAQAAGGSVKAKANSLAKRLRAQVVGMGSEVSGGGHYVLRSLSEAQAETRRSLDRAIRSLYGAP